VRHYSLADVERLMRIHQAIEKAFSNPRIPERILVAAYDALRKATAST